MTTRNPHPGPAARLLLLLGLAASLGPTCKPFNSIGYFEPAEGRIQVKAQPVLVWGRMGKNFDAATAAFAIDGVDLVAALGLTPPFENAGGVVAVGPDLVTVSGFTFQPSGTQASQFTVVLAGLPPGPHLFTTSAERAGDLVAVDRTFQLVDGFAQELAGTTSMGLVGGPRTLGAKVLANESLGQAIAAPPAALAGGGSVRSGHVEAAEGRIAGGGS